MKASELRIGNWVEIPQDAIDAMWHQCGEKCEKYHQVTGLKKYAHLSDDIKFPYEDLLPIPFTEDWLVKFGFEVIKHVSSKIDLPNGFLEIETDFSYGINSTMEANNHGHWYSGTLEYVHQLQNLYHALTGQELEIKDNAST